MPLTPGEPTAVSRYFAPDFFSPFYFAPLAATGSQAAHPARYFAPTYFSKYYFPSLFADQTAPSSDETRFSDHGAFAALVALLGETGAFADVTFGTTADRRPGGADLTPAAVVTPVGWTESDDTDPTFLVREVTFDLTLAVRDEDPVARFEALDRLTGLALDAVDGADLGGGCFPVLTMFRQGSYDPNPVYPEQRVVIRGGFSYLIPSLNGHSVTVSA